MLARVGSGLRGDLAGDLGTIAFDAAAAPTDGLLLRLEEEGEGGAYRRPGDCANGGVPLLRL